MHKRTPPKNGIQNEEKVAGNGRGIEKETREKFTNNGLTKNPKINSPKFPKFAA
jgi:hypothetical protein